MKKTPSLDELQNEIEQLIISDQLILPTLPEIALRVREACANPDATLQSLADILKEDPSLTARIIKIANSPIMRSAIKVDNLMQAITRLGLNYVQNVTTGLAMEQIFQATNELIDQKLCETWAHSKLVSATATIIAKHYTHLPVDKVTLAGLVHQIGVLPILTYLENNDIVITDKSMLEQLIQALHPQLGTLILQIWRFPSDIVNVPVEYRQYTRKTATNKPDYADVITVANILNTTQSPQPEATAYQRLKLEADFSFAKNPELVEELRLIQSTDH